MEVRLVCIGLIQGKVRKKKGKQTVETRDTGQEAIVLAEGGERGGLQSEDSSVQ